jgi:autotransporter strand-loop-strand O-heptosyltransferase
MNDNVYFNGSVLGLGDTIALIPFLNIYKIKNNKNIFFLTNFYSLFENKYKNIFFIKDSSKISINDSFTNIEYNGKNFMVYERYNLAYDTVHYIKNNFQVLKNERLPLQQQFSKFIGIDFKEEIKPQINICNQNFNHQNKYICISTQSTAQAKYWNYQQGWEKVVEYLKKIGYDVICLDKYEVFGNLVYMNNIPKNAINKTGLPLDKVANIINKCDFFIGLDSGLSWLAWALNKKVIQILGMTGKSIAFKNEYGIVNENVCNDCFSDKNVTIFSDSSPFTDFLMCPKHKNTSRIFECTKYKTPEMIIQKIDQILNEKTK